MAMKLLNFRKEGIIHDSREFLLLAPWFFGPHGTKASHISAEKAAVIREVLSSVTTIQAIPSYSSPSQGTMEAAEVPTN